MTDDPSLPLRITGLGTRYGGDRWALRDVDVEVPAGTTLAVLGPSGCGKSTLLKLVAGLERPEKGEVHVGERRLSAPGDAVSPDRRGIGMVFQDYALWPHMRVRDIVGYGLRHGRHRVAAAERRRRVADVLELLHLTGLEGRRPAELSGGQQQRVSIARALATRPGLLLFDEPLSNLDTRLRVEMREELAQLLRELGTTALYVTHDVGEALAVADRILVLDQGTPVQLATPQEVFSHPSSGWVASLAGFSSRLRPDAVDVDGETAAITIGEGSLTGRYCGSGPTAEAYLHPDGVRVAGRAADARTGGDVRGRVRSCVFEGRVYRMRVDLPGAGTVALSAQEPYAPGDAVALTADPDAVLVFGGPALDHGRAVVAAGNPGGEG